MGTTYTDYDERGRALQILAGEDEDFVRICADCANGITVPTTITVEPQQGDAELCAWCGKVVPGSAHDRLDALEAEHYRRLGI